MIGIIGFCRKYRYKSLLTYTYLFLLVNKQRCCLVFDCQVVIGPNIIMHCSATFSCVSHVLIGAGVVTAICSNRDLAVFSNNGAARGTCTHQHWSSERWLKATYEHNPRQSCLKSSSQPQQLQTRHNKQY